MTKCDVCGAEAVNCIGGTHYYCAGHEDEVVEMHIRDMSDDD